MFIFSKSAIEERRRSGKPTNRVALRVPEQALSFLPIINPAELQPISSSIPSKNSRSNVLPQKAVPNGRKPLKPLTLPGSKPILGQTVIGLRPRGVSEEASTIPTADDLLRESLSSSFEPPLGIALSPDSPSSENEMTFDYNRYLKCNRRESGDPVKENVAKRKSLRKSVSKRSAAPLCRDSSAINDEFGAWTCFADAAENIVPWKIKKNTKRVAEVVAAFLKLHRNVFHDDMEVINNMVTLKSSARAKSPYPKNFVVWLRGDRIYDLEADRGTLEEFIQDCTVAHVSDFNRPEVRNRRSAQGLPAFPYAPGELSKARESASVDE